MMKKIKPALILSALITLALIAGCKKDPDSNLTPARQLTGTWKTALPVTFYIKTDFCSTDLELVATQDRMVTMEIKETSNYTVDITFTYSGSDFTFVNPDCTSTGYVPDVSPMFLKGTLSATQLTVSDTQYKVLGIFEFTTDLMEGTWNDLWCVVFCQNVYTETNELKLTLQH